MIDRAGIAALIPHAGTMCLLDHVAAWDAMTILCRSVSQCAPAHPMAQDGVLSGICGVEYAAQAMALHGALTGGEGSAPKAGFLASLREVRLMAARLDTFDVLEISAERLFAEEGRVIYGFAISGDGAAVMSGRVAAVLQA